MREMILLTRKMSHKQQLLEVVMRRLPNSDAEYMYFKEQWRRVSAGLAGEQRVDRAWKELDIPGRYYLFHDLQLENEVGFTHQIDTLFFCPYFVLVVEIKNIVGRIEFQQEHHQFVRVDDKGVASGFSNPFDQVQRHAQFLRKLFHKQGNSIPILRVVVSANPNMILTQSLQSQPIFHVSGLAHKIGTLFQQFTIRYFDDKQLRHFAKKLVKMHTPRQWQLKIEWSKLRKGALCPHCEFRHTLRFIYGKWRCEVCKQIDNLALFTALSDYRYMHGASINNRQFSDFFGIACSKTAYKLLKSLQFREVGAKKNRQYIIPELR